MNRYHVFRASRTSHQRAAAERALSLYTRWIPALWLVGFQIIAGALLLAWLSISQKLKSNRARILLFSWAVVALMQAIAVVYNWNAVGGDAAMLARKLLSLPLIGWLLLGGILALGCELRLATPRLVRSLMVFSLGLLAAGAVAILTYLLTDWESVGIPTLPERLAPSSENWRVFTQALLYSTEYFAGGQVPRMTLFNPYPTIMALAGTCLLFIARLEVSWRWRAVGTAAGLFAMIFSFSRAAAPAFVFGLCLYLLLRRSWVLLGMLFAALTVALLVLVLIGSNPATWIDTLIDALHGARAGSSSARDLIYFETWRAFEESPVFGWGWLGPSVLDTEPLPIGSHSTFYGTLYTGGIVTFASLVIATAVTAAMLLPIALRGDKVACVGVATLSVFVVFGYSESLYTAVLPLFPILLCMGGMMAARITVPAAGPDPSGTAPSSRIARRPSARAAAPSAAGPR